MRFKKIYIEITNICNKNCPFCSVDSRKKQEMELAQFEHILKEIKPYTKYLYLHVKGEPLLHSHLKEILKLTEQYGMIVNLTTNGTLLKKRLPDLLSVANIRQINVSLHSFDKEPHYMEDILYATNELLKKTSIYMNYRFWALENHELTEKNRVLIRQIEQYFECSMIPSLEKEHHSKIHSHLFIEEGEKFDWPTLSSSFFREHGTCYGLRTHLAILVDGTVVPCCLDSDGKIPLGNLFEESFFSILEKDKTKNILSGFQKNQFTEELCKHCTYCTRFLK